MNEGRNCEDREGGKVQYVHRGLKTILCTANPMGLAANLEIYDGGGGRQEKRIWQLERTSKTFPSERETRSVKVIHCRRSPFPPSARKWPKGEREVSVRFRFNGRNGPLVRSSQMAAEEFSYWKKWDPRSAPLKKALGPSENFLCMRPTNNFIFAACCNQAFLPIPLLALPAAASFAGETKEKQTKKRERFFCHPSSPCCFV